MSISAEEEQLYQKIKKMKRENEYLMVIYEELLDLIREDYKGPFKSESTRGVFYAVNEYEKWKIK